MSLLADPELARLVLAQTNGHLLSAHDRNRLRIAASIAMQAADVFLFIDRGEGRFHVGRSGRLKGFRPDRVDAQEALQVLHALVAAGGAKRPGCAHTPAATRQRLQRAAAAVGRRDPELGQALKAGITVSGSNLMAFDEGSTPIRVCLP